MQADEYADDLDIHHPTLSAAAQAAAVAEVAAWDARARRHETPCGNGRMVWRQWGEGLPVVIMHGGAGAWQHWIRNLEPLLQTGRSVWAPDLPGLGDSDLPEPLDMDTICRTVEDCALLVHATSQRTLPDFSRGPATKTSTAATINPVATKKGAPGR